MNSSMLLEEIKRMGIDERAVNIGEIAYCDECFNLIKRKDGKWEVFYGEHGQKTNVRVFETEEEASEALLEILKRTVKGRSQSSLPFLPVGSVVRLEGGKANLVIVARALLVKGKDGNNVYFDYGAFPYPYGMVDGKMAYFQKDAIEEILFTGFVNEQEHQTMEYLNQFAEINKNVPRGNANSFST